MSFIDDIIGVGKSILGAGNGLGGNTQRQSI